MTFCLCGCVLEARLGGGVGQNESGSEYRDSLVPWSGHETSIYREQSDSAL